LGLIKDIYDISKDIFHDPLKEWSKDKKLKNNVLKSFSPDFLKHDKSVTDIASYYLWNDERSRWDTGTGRLLAVSHKETEAFWGVPERYSVYEGFMLRFVKNGGEISRIFILNWEIFDPVKQYIFLKATYRQHLFGFNPFIASFFDLDFIKKELEVECDMFFSINDNMAYFLQMNPIPVILYTVDEKYIKKISKCHFELKKRAMRFEDWYKRNPFQVDLNKIQKDAEKECNLIYEIAGIK